MNTEEAKARLEATRNLKVESCPRCDKGICNCYTSGEFWELQKKLRTIESELKTLNVMLDIYEAALENAMDGLKVAYECAPYECNSSSAGAMQSRIDYARNNVSKLLDTLIDKRK